MVRLICRNKLTLVVLMLAYLAIEARLATILTLHAVSRWLRSDLHGIWVAEEYRLRSLVRWRVMWELLRMWECNHRGMSHKQSLLFLMISYHLFVVGVELCLSRESRSHSTKLSFARIQFNNLVLLLRKVHHLLRALIHHWCILMNFDLLILSNFRLANNVVRIEIINDQIIATVEIHILISTCMHRWCLCCLLVFVIRTHYIVLFRPCEFNHRSESRYLTDHTFVRRIICNNLSRTDDFLRVQRRLLSYRRVFPGDCLFWWSWWCMVLQRLRNNSLGS